MAFDMNKDMHIHLDDGSIIKLDTKERYISLSPEKKEKLTDEQVQTLLDSKTK